MVNGGHGLTMKSSTSLSLNTKLVMAKLHLPQLTTWLRLRHGLLWGLKKKALTLATQDFFVKKGKTSVVVNYFNSSFK